jgi:hypothetical protein
MEFKVSYVGMRMSSRPRWIEVYSSDSEVEGVFLREMSERAAQRASYGEE